MYATDDSKQQRITRPSLLKGKLHQHGTVIKRIKAIGQSESRELNVLILIQEGHFLFMNILSNRYHRSILCLIDVITVQILPKIKTDLFSSIRKTHLYQDIKWLNFPIQSLHRRMYMRNSRRGNKAGKGSEEQVLRGAAERPGIVSYREKKAEGKTLLLSITI